VDAWTVITALALLVAVATVIGLVYARSQGRSTRSSGEKTVSIDGVTLGERATLLQFSTEICAPCVATARVLSEVAATAPSVSHVDIDVTDRPELASEFNLFQTPTTLILDRKGVVRARIGGAVRRDVVTAELDRVLASA
jgi:thiol-disulfide isomerase/thioredoxin